MKKLFVRACAIGVAGLIVTVLGCGGGKPMSKMEQMVSDMVDHTSGVTDYALAGQVKREYKGDAIPVILEYAYKMPPREKGFGPAYAYVALLIPIEAEPARLNACKTLIFGDKDSGGTHPPHPETVVRAIAVEGLCFPKSTEEGLKIAMDIAKSSSDIQVKATALRAISNSSVRDYGGKYDVEICKILRQAAKSDPDQIVREHAARGIERRKKAGGCRQ